MQLHIKNLKQGDEFWEWDEIFDWSDKWVALDDAKKEDNMWFCDCVDENDKPIVFSISEKYPQYEPAIYDEPHHPKAEGFRFPYSLTKLSFKTTP